ncbi:MAG: hypothetical protein IT561_08810 [Alphaproteobacteria bacterium]|nr:hypothetical protein [Alphaproteobacteria bacterium]
MIQLVFLLLLAVVLARTPEEPVTATLANASRPTTCAEEENVLATLSSPTVRAFRIAVRHPPYIADVGDGNSAPDYSGCPGGSGPPGPGAPRFVSLHEDAEIRVLGVVFPASGRPAEVPVRVGERTVEGLHLVQAYRLIDGKPVEFLVLDPPDGSWRARPLPPPPLPDSVYGSSFLIGPVGQGERTTVDLAAVDYDAAKRTFVLRFRRGGTAAVTIDRIDATGLDLAVVLDAAIGEGPFAALRSMFVAADHADVAEAAWTGDDGGEAAAPILAAGPVEVAAVRFRRPLPSRHNPSAPDHSFEGFLP